MSVAQSKLHLSAIILTLNVVECRAEWKTCAAKQHNFRTLFQPYYSAHSYAVQGAIRRGCPSRGVEDETLGLVGIDRHEV